MASTTPIDTTQIETTLSRYELGERVAVGGMSEVYRALDLQTGETVAIKMLLPQHASNLEIRRGIEREAELQRIVSHPNLVRLHDVITDTHTTGLVLEWVPGFTLAQILEMAGDHGLGPDTTRYIGERLLDAIAAIHNATDPGGTSLHIVHRDIKPGNIMLTSDGEVKLADFGIARSVFESHTRTGTVKGSLAYLAPEQATESTIDARTDLYLAGLVLFETLTGARYLRGEREIDLLRAAEDPTEQRPSEHGAPSSWDRLFNKALARFPEERFRSAEAFKKALAGHGDHPEWPDLKLARLFAERPALRALPSPPPKPKRRWVKPATLLAGGVAIALGVHTALRAQLADAVAPSPTSLDASTLAAQSAGGGLSLGAADEELRETRSTSGEEDTTLADENPRSIPADPPVPKPRGRAASTKPRAPDVASSTRRNPGTAANAIGKKTTIGSPDTAAKLEDDRRVADAAQTSDAEPTLTPSETERRANAREGLRAAVARLRERGLTENDLPNPLLARLQRDACSDGRTVSQCETSMAKNVAALDEITLSRELLEKKVARLRQALPRNADEGIKQKSNLALQALLDGRLAVANRYLNSLEENIKGRAQSLRHN